MDVDLLFIEFLENNSEDCLMKIVRELSPWLYQVVYYLFPDEFVAAKIVDDSWKEFIKHKNNFEPKKISIKYEVYNIAKKIALSKT